LRFEKHSGIPWTLTIPPDQGALAFSSAVSGRLSGGVRIADRLPEMRPIKRKQSLACGHPDELCTAIACHRRERFEETGWSMIENASNYNNVRAERFRDF